MRSKRVTIVFEEKTDGTFEVLLEGVNTHELKKLSQNEWSSPEFWGTVSFQLVQDFLLEAGVVKTLRFRDEES